MKYFFIVMMAVSFLTSRTCAQTFGIGIDAPQATLHVVGNVRVDGMIAHPTTTMVVVRDSNGYFFYRDLQILFDTGFVCGDTLLDTRDGQKYTTTKIGSQCWMAENLNYRTSTGSWYYMNDSVVYARDYGRYYSWTIVMSGAPSSNSFPSNVQGICPLGWHLPSREEWDLLVAFGIFGSDRAGHLKERGLAHWQAPNSGATNFTGFTARAGGNRNGPTGQFVAFGVHAEFWSATETSSTAGLGYKLEHDDTQLQSSGYWKGSGLTCRCVKD